MKKEKEEKGAKGNEELREKVDVTLDEDIVGKCITYAIFKK